MKKTLSIGGHILKSRLFLGTGKFNSSQALADAIEASGSQLVTVALRRINFNQSHDDILSVIDRKKVEIMVNTSGARTAQEAIQIAKVARHANFNWIKLEIHPDPHYLLPDPIETLAAAEFLVKEGFIVLPYMNADPVLAKRLEDVGVHAVMPLGAPIGSNQGLQTEAMLRIIIENACVPVVVDAGLGVPSHAAHAIELGADAVLVNTAIAAATYPTEMARAFKYGVEAAEMAVNAGVAGICLNACASSPMDIF